ncbi:MAG: serine--tRNA ligase [Lachnospiraceae bacterium]|nr:serine--tRNA ligase [Lachnospiraceae bacterium]
MIDLKFLRENPDAVKENIRKKFQEHKLPLVDEVIELDGKARSVQQEADSLRANRNSISKQIGALMGQGKKDEAMALKEQVGRDAARLEELEGQEKELQERITQIMMTIPNIIDPSVPIGRDDSCNVEIEKYGEPVVPDYEIPYHTQIMERFDGIDLDAAGKVAGNGFYYLMGDIARLHSAVISYARDFMIDRGFTYCVPPFMIRSNVVTGVMSFDEMDAMMYKIEGEDLYLIGTSEHSMIGKFIDTIQDEEKLPYTLTSYSPCFRKEKGAHGIEERGVYRIHQFEKQEMIVVCKPEDSMFWYDKLWQNTVDLFRSLDIPVRTLECCSGDLADLKVKSCDVEAWSPRQQKYFEVGSCSNLGDAQARRLKIRVKGTKGKYFAHTLNNTVVAPPRMLIAFLENNLNADGSVRIPEALQPYMGGKEVLTPLHD